MDEFEFNDPIIEWDDRHCKLFIEFLNRLDYSRIRYIILKNADGLPYQNFSKDVDILIEPGSYKKAAELLDIAFKDNGILNCRVSKFERLRCHHGMNPIANFAIHIDLIEGFFHKGFEVIPFDILYKQSFRNKNNVVSLNPVYESLVLLLHSTICFHKIKDKYIDSISLEYKKSRAIMIPFIQNILGQKSGNEMIHFLDQSDYSSIAKFGKKFSRSAKILCFYRRPFSTIFHVCDFLSDKIARIVVCKKKYQMSITVHAPDGTGKTTFIKELSEKIGFLFVCNASEKVHIYHFRPQIIPNLGAVGENIKIMKEDKNFTVPHRAKPSGSINSFMRIVYYWLDYKLGVPLTLRRDVQFDKFTIYDRYIYDFLIDPFRTRIKLPYWVRKLFVKSVKQPQISFILVADPETVYKRKQELGIDEITRQIEALKKLERQNKRFCVIDANRTPQQMVDEAIMHVMNRFTHQII